MFNFEFTSDFLKAAGSINQPQHFIKLTPFLSQEVKLGFKVRLKSKTLALGFVFIGKHFILNELENDSYNTISMSIISQTQTLFPIVRQ